MNKGKFSRRSFIRQTALGAGSILLAGCGVPTSVTEVVEPTTPAMGNPTELAPTQAPTEPIAAAPTATTAAQPTEAPFKLGVTPGSPTHEKGWVTKLPPPPDGMPVNPPAIVTSSRNSVNLKFAQGDDFENSPFTRLVKEHLGIEWKVKFTFGTDDERSQKYNLAMASNDLPDFMEAVPLAIFLNMVEADQVEDITEVFDRVASDKLKKNYGWNNNLPWIYAEVNGRKLGLPFIEAPSGHDHFLWYRQDWLEKLGLSVPKTFDELAQVALAFKESGLTQGAKGTAIGLVCSKHFNTWHADLNPIFAAYETVPNFWLKGPDGSLVFGATLPGTKEALTLLNQWYKMGVIPAEFDTLEPWDAQARVAANQSGLYFGAHWASLYGPPDSLKNDPNAVFNYTQVPVGPSGKPRFATATPTVGLVHCFRKGFKDVEAVIKYVNWMAEWYDTPLESRMHGWDTYNYAWEGNNIELTEAGDAWRFWPYGPIGNSANNRSDPEAELKQAEIMESWSSLPADQLDAAQELMLKDEGGFNSMSRKAYIEAMQIREIQGIRNEFYGQPTVTMIERQADLDTLVSTQLIGMVKGTIPLDDFDQFVQDWKDQGGDQITVEVNQWYANRK